ncbi:tyrosine-protein kinase receptor Tie-1-like [Anneissia japonica]|uniref:tyrosine-protein kinase receptor Tie-1-like n=1 Tax=Anneissia japonica TaxID=1529436 RepID=UPI0014257FAF|nr:tyrosine-protein kinase receptor Tie-1-like [Anneissia japonica]
MAPEKNYEKHYEFEQATVKAKHRTITTSIGETVELVMTLDKVEASRLRWKKDGGSDIKEWEGLSNVSLENVRKNDAGIYECYPVGQRHMGKHAILRLLVRECSREKWWLPNCEQDCPVCYNGGVCSVNLGSCICPPGFKGDNCEHADNLTTDERSCIKQLRQNPNIVIKPADKGSAVTILNTHDYITEAE